MPLSNRKPSKKSCTNESDYDILKMDIFKDDPVIQSKIADLRQQQ